jgi:hypothetical protein
MRAPQFFLTAIVVAFSVAPVGAMAAPIVGLFRFIREADLSIRDTDFARSPGQPNSRRETSVIVSPGGYAEIVYDEYCRIPVKPGQVAVVAPVSPCARGADLGLPVKAPPAASPPAASPDNTGYYLLGGAAAVGLGVGIWALTKSSSSSPAPASP